MEIQVLRRSVVSSCAAAAMLAGCGGSQPPIGAPGAMPQSSAITTNSERGRSWMAPNTARDNLLYVANAYYYTGVTVYRLGSTKLVGTLGGFSHLAGVCSDSSGNVYVVDQGRSSVFEYPHGGTNRIKTLRDPYVYPGACSVDKTTGNLAVTDDEGGVLIYADASGTPTRYLNYHFVNYYFVAYDDRGNLLVDGEAGSGPQFAELPKGGSTLTSITLNANIASPEGIAWDGKYFAICDQGQRPNVIDDFSVSGSTGTLKGTVTLDDSITLLGLAISPLGYTRGGLPRRKEIIAADINNDARNGYVWYWRYPKGGSPIKTITKKVREPVGVAVSKGGRQLHRRQGPAEGLAAASQHSSAAVSRRR